MTNFKYGTLMKTLDQNLIQINSKSIIYYRIG